MLGGLRALPICVGWGWGPCPGGDGPRPSRSRSEPAGRSPVGGAGAQGGGRGTAAGGDYSAPGAGRGPAAEVSHGEGPLPVPGGRGLRAQSPDLGRSFPQYGSEVEELQQHLTAAKEVQQQLRMEVSPGEAVSARPGGESCPAAPGALLQLCSCPASCGICRRSTRSAAGCCRRPRRR